jgi:hypothetical protein
LVVDRDLGAVRLMPFGEAGWLLPDGEFTYGAFPFVEVTYDGDRSNRAGASVQERRTSRPSTAVLEDRTGNGAKP